MAAPTSGHADQSVVMGLYASSDEAKRVATREPASLALPASQSDRTVSLWPSEPARRSRYGATAVLVAGEMSSRRLGGLARA